MLLVRDFSHWERTPQHRRKVSQSRESILQGDLSQ